MNLGVKRSVLIVDNYVELLSIISLYPNLKNIYVVLLSRNFTLSEVTIIFDSYQAFWFDELIDRTDAKTVINKKNDFIWDWFLDENGMDLSEINGCSLGSAFVPNLSNLLNTTLRYRDSFGNFLSSEDSVYFLSGTEDIFIDVIYFLHKKIGFEAIPINLSDDKKVLYRGLSIDIDGRKRDLIGIFNKSLFLKSLISFLLDKFQGTLGYKDNKVLFMHSGKMEVFIKHSIGSASENNWIMPVMKPYEMVDSILKRKAKLYQFYSLSLSNDDLIRINKNIDKLKKNIVKKKYIDSDLLIKIMNRYVFDLFSKAYGYYSCVLDKIQLLQPKAIIFSAESLEVSLLAAQAGKKSGVKNIIMPHGLISGGDIKNKIGRFSVFDNVLAFGRIDVMGHCYLGMKKDKIQIAPFPYFEKFLPIIKSKGTKKYSNAIVLADDLGGYYTDNIGSSFRYFQDLSKLLEELEINLCGIKFRHNLFSKVGIDNIDDHVEIDGKTIPILSGYSSFKDSAQNADLIIGPHSTALIEAGLMGKDYFVYLDTEFIISELDSTRWPIDKYMYISYSIDQLRENIENNRVYKNGFSVNDFVDLSKINNRKDLFKKFNMVVNNIINDSKV